MTWRGSAWVVAASGSAFVLGVTALLWTLVRWGAPGRLVWSAAVAALPLLAASWQQWRQRMTHLLGTHEEAIVGLQVVPPRWSRVGQAAAWTLAAWMLVLGLARPQWGEQPREIERRGIDVVIALDLSRSMWAQDVLPSRLEATVFELEAFLRTLRADRVGLVVFAAHAVVQAPLTTDYGAIRHYLRRASPLHFDRQGTAIGRAIEASTRLLVGGDNPSFRRAPSQVIVVLSDGEDSRTRPVDAAASALAEGIHVYTVGVGTPEGATMPIQDALGQVTGLVLDRRGQPAVSRLVEDQLMEVARAGGGDYLRLSSEGALTPFLQQAFSRYEQAALSSLLHLEYEDRFLVFLWPALLFFLLGWWLGTTPARIAVRGAMLVSAWLLAGCDGQLPGPMREDPAARRALEASVQEAWTEARSALEEAGPEARRQPGFHYLTGWIEEQARVWDRAQAAYLRALAEEDADQQVRGLTALGNVLLARGEYAQAIERFRRALLLDPTHEDARHNLELALLRLYPPCATLEGEEEPDDEASAARPLASVVWQGPHLPPGVDPPAEGVSRDNTSHVLCPGNPDWMQIPVLGGATLDIEVRLDRLRPDRGGPVLPDRMPPTDVRIALLGSDGETVLAVDQGLDPGPDEDGRVAVSPLTRHLREVAIPDGYAQGSMVYLKVESSEPLEYRYTVTGTFTPPCWALEDPFESNDMRSTARAMESGDHQAWTCPGNDDWYRVQGADARTVVVEVTAPPELLGHLHVEWYRDNDTQPFQSQALAPESPRASFIHWSLPDRTPPGGGDPLWPDQPPLDTLRWRIVNGSSDAQGGYAMLVRSWSACPEDDPLEPNDSADARTMVGEQVKPPLRWLRFCPDNHDWFDVPLPQPPQAAAGGATDPPEPRTFGVMAELILPWQQAEGAVFTLPDGTMAAQLEPATLDGVRHALVASLQVEDGMERAVVGLAGTAGYYHLEFPDFQSSQQQQQQDSEESDGEDGDEQEGDPDDGEPEPRDGEPEESENAESQEDDAEQESATEDAAEETAPEEETDRADSTEEPASDEARRRQELLELLDALERGDVNLQVQQAQQDLPPERWEEAW